MFGISILSKIFGDDDDDKKSAQQQAFAQRQKESKKEVGLTLYKEAMKRAYSSGKLDPRIKLVGSQYRDLDFSASIKKHLKDRNMMTTDTKRRLHAEIKKDYINHFARKEQDPVGQLIAFENLNRMFSIPDDVG